MFWSNVVQIFLITFLMVDDPEDMWWLITVSGIMVHLTICYRRKGRSLNFDDEDDLITT